MVTKSMICVVCPVGCRMTVEVGEDNGVESVVGNTCGRGKKYAVMEIQNPVRTLTTTVKLSGFEDKMLPVKTSVPIAKSKLFVAMEEVRGIVVDRDINVGDIIIRDFIDKGIDLIACKAVKKN